MIHAIEAAAKFAALLPKLPEPEPLAILDQLAAATRQPDIIIKVFISENSNEDH